MRKPVVAMIVLMAVLCAAACGADKEAATAETKAPADGSPKVEKVERHGCTVEMFALHSKLMDLDIKVAIVLPPEYAKNPEKKYPVLFTLHGHAAPYDTFSQMGPLLKSLKEKPMIVTCFDANDSKSGYADSPNDPKSQFTSFFFKEFVPYVEKNYRVNGQCGVTGFSMGGSGAFHYMCVQPKKFISVSAMSTGYGRRGSAPPAGGDNADSKRPRRPQTESVYDFIEKAIKEKAKFPRLLLACGTEDERPLAGTRQFRDFLKEKKVPFEYYESPGAHKWDYWQATSDTIVDFHWRTFQPGYKVIEHPNPAAAKTDEKTDGKQ
ncbi:MAG: hypothetical protein JXL80_07605 [Planctomycetes bacterium]|nr:hypothetical protein [Planctomycetota bacterium]